MRKEYLEALYRRDESIEALEQRLERLETYLNIEYCKKSPDSFLYPRYIKKRNDRRQEAMMDTTKIKEAVGWAKAEVELLYGYDDVLNKNTKDMLNILIDLAESVLSIAGKMPQRKEILRGEDEVECFTASNEMLDVCTLAAAGMIPEQKEQSDFSSDPSICFENKGWNACRDAILKAQKERE